MQQDPHTLLVVDDNEMNRDMLARRLERKGYRVLRAEDGQPALDAVQTEPVDLVLLDIMMPGMSGIEVLRTLREEHDARALPVIMATAKTESEDVVEALDLGANDYVTKPIDFPVVLARIKTQLRDKTPAQAPVGTAPVGPGAAAAGTSSADESDLEGAPRTVDAGEVIAGRYRLEAEIGRGNFGTVYKARHLELDHDVAVKVLHSVSTATPDLVARFRREGVSACRIQHPNAVRVFDFGVTEGGVAYLVMELLAGFSLEEELRHRRRVSPQRAIAILQSVCAVLAAAHAADIVHRDIKPANIFLQQTPYGEVVKVLDFGIAKLVGEDAARHQLTAEGWLLGTPGYMAPERLRNRDYDGRSDVYSVGIMLFEMLTGQMPFIARNHDPMALAMMHVREPLPLLSFYIDKLPTALDEIITLAAAKRADDRPTAEHLAIAFTGGEAARQHAASQGDARFARLQRCVAEIVG